MTHEKAISILIEYAGTQFDPRIVDVFVNLPREILTKHCGDRNRCRSGWSRSVEAVAG